MGIPGFNIQQHYRENQPSTESLGHPRNLSFSGQKEKDSKDMAAYYANFDAGLVPVDNLMQEIEELRHENSYLKGYAFQVSDRRDIW